MTVVWIVIAVVARLTLLVAAASIHVLKQYERKCRLGRVGDDAFGPAASPGGTSCSAPTPATTSDMEPRLINKRWSLLISSYLNS
jgi:hypothetical protein